MSWLAAAGVAAWLGILTSISPCPLAGNVAAITLISRGAGRAGASLAACLLYTLGRVLAYVALAAAVLAGLARSGPLARFLQEYMNQLLGPLLILAGLWLLEWIGRSFSLALVTGALHKRTQSSPVVWAGVLGFLLALSFCPAPAAMFFATLLPLCQAQDSQIFLPVVFGIGTAVPVLVFLVLLLAAQPLLTRVLARVRSFEKVLRTATAVVLIAIGVYYCLRYIYEVPI
jgi:cytochrome c biogenesis protein CcdA